MKPNTKLPFQRPISDLSFASTTTGIYVPMKEGASDTDAEVVTEEYGVLEDGATLTANTGQWTGTPAWWTGGASEAVEFARSDGASAWDSVFGIGEGVALIAMALNFSGDPAQLDALLQIGVLNSTDGGEAYGITLRIGTDGRIDFVIDDQTPTEHTDGGLDVVATNSGDIIYFVHIDNRVGVKTLIDYAYTPGTDTVVAGSTSDISALGAINCYDPGAPNDSRLVIGAERNASASSYPRHLTTGTVRRFRFFNFGTTAPSNITQIMDALSKSYLADTAEIEGI